MTDCTDRLPQTALFQISTIQYCTVLYHRIVKYYRCPLSPPWERRRWPIDAAIDLAFLGEFVNRFAALVARDGGRLGEGHCFVGTDGSVVPTPFMPRAGAAPPFYRARWEAPSFILCAAGGASFISRAAGGAILRVASLLLAMKELQDDMTKINIDFGK